MKTLLIAVFFALFASSVLAQPVAPRILSPIAAATQTPIFSWNKVSSATWYYLWVNNAAGRTVVQTWFMTTAVCGGSICSVAPGMFTGDTYTWWVEAYDSTGYAWSSSLTFYTTIVSPTSFRTFISTQLGDLANQANIFISQYPTNTVFSLGTFIVLPYNGVGYQNYALSLMAGGIGPSTGTFISIIASPDSRLGYLDNSVSYLTASNPTKTFSVGNTVGLPDGSWAVSVMGK
jgi:hypothetical protein